MLYAGDQMDLDETSDFDCPYCDQSFEKATSLYGHLHVHEGPHECFKCSFVADSVSVLWKHHRMAHHRELLNQCSQCQAAFVKPSQLKYHVRQVHLRFRPFYCGVCEKGFSRRSDLKQHSLLHESNRLGRHKCDVCQRTFAHVSNLNRHVGTHLAKGERPEYVCPQCPDKRYRQVSGLWKHTRKIHGVKEAVRVKKGYCEPRKTSPSESVRERESASQCENASTVFANKVPEVPTAVFDDDVVQQTALNDSSAAVVTASVQVPACDPEPLPADNAPYQPCNSQGTKSAPALLPCQFCDKTFTRRTSLVQHTRLHGGTQKLTCPHCQETFSWTTTWKRHIWSVHLKEEKGFQCDSCHKRFQTEGKLVVHVRRDHKKERQFTCQSCDKSFFRREELRTHLRTHANEKPYKCASCDKKFGHISNLRRHEKTHKGIRDFCCEICSKWFTQKHALQGHYKRFHQKGEKQQDLQQ